MKLLELKDGVRALTYRLNPRALVAVICTCLLHVLLFVLYYLPYIWPKLADASTVTLVIAYAELAALSILIVIAGVEYTLACIKPSIFDAPPRQVLPIAIGSFALFEAILLIVNGTRMGFGNAEVWWRTAVNVGGFWTLDVLVLIGFRQYDQPDRWLPWLFALWLTG